MWVAKKSGRQMRTFSHGCVTANVQCRLNCLLRFLSSICLLPITLQTIQQIPTTVKITRNTLTDLVRDHHEHSHHHHGWSSSHLCHNAAGSQRHAVVTVAAATDGGFFVRELPSIRLRRSTFPTVIRQSFRLESTGLCCANDAFAL